MKKQTTYYPSINYHYWSKMLQQLPEIRKAFLLMQESGTEPYNSFFTKTERPNGKIQFEIPLFLKSLDDFTALIQRDFPQAIIKGPILNAVSTTCTVVLEVSSEEGNKLEKILLQAYTFI